MEGPLAPSRSRVRGIDNIHFTRFTGASPFRQVLAGVCIIATMSEDGEGPYDNSHRAFLQAFLANLVLTFQDAKPILAAIITAHRKALG